MEHSKKGSFLFHLVLHVFYFPSGVIVFLPIGPQIYSCLKKRKLMTLVTTMPLDQLPGTEVLNGSLCLTAAIIPSEGHAKYVCVDPWINALITTVIAYLVVRCRHDTLCRGLEYATACHVYIFASGNKRYSTHKISFHHRTAVQLCKQQEITHRSPDPASRLSLGHPLHQLKGC